MEMPAAYSLRKMGQVESSGGDGVGSDDAAASMIQRFWDSAMALGPLDDETDTQSQMRLFICGSSELFGSSISHIHCLLASLI
jgi:hypothetical protein